MHLCEYIGQTLKADAIFRTEKKGGIKVKVPIRTAADSTFSDIFSLISFFHFTRIFHMNCLHNFFIALTFAGSLGSCLKTQPPVFKQHVWEPANVSTWKEIYDPLRRIIKKNKSLIYKPKHMLWVLKMRRGFLAVSTIKKLLKLIDNMISQF